MSDTKTDQQAQVVFMGIYIILFAGINNISLLLFPFWKIITIIIALLFTFELLQICSCCEALDTMYKKNFGFFYGVVGKSCYMILIGVFAFGLDVSGTAQQINYSAAVLMAASGFFAVIIHCVNPNFFDKKEKYRP